MTTHYDPYPRQAAAPAMRAYAPPRAAADDWSPPTIQNQAGPGGLRVDGLALAALLIVAFLVIQSVLDREGGNEESLAIVTAGQAAESVALTSAGSATDAEAAQAKDRELAPPAPALPADPFAISYPYDDYWITQGPHGYSYGHIAIDLAAGKGSPIKSPIHGKVTANYVDQYGNTTLIIENEVYAVTLLHGNYSVAVGQEVTLGDVVGSEGNNGYTTDMNGRSCRNRDCGYHSHLNVYNKQTLANVNPLDVLK